MSEELKKQIFNMLQMFFLDNDQGKVTKWLASSLINEMKYMLDNYKEKENK